MPRRLLFTVAAILFLQAFASAKNTNTLIPPPDSPYVKLDSMWVEYGVKEENVNGMRIHFKFTTYNMKDIDAYVALYFEYDDEEGGNLMDKNNKYVSSDGHVAVYRSIRPGYTTTVYKDFQVFMPYEEFDLSPGSYDLMIDAKIIKREGGIIAPLKWHFFYYDQPAK